MTRTLILVLLAVMVGFAVSCSDSDQPVTAPGGGDPAVLPLNFVGGVTDPAGDAIPHPDSEFDPDLIGAMVSCDGEMITFTVECTAESFAPEGVYIGFHLDADQDPATGFPGVDLANNDAGIIGEEFVLYVGDTGPMARLLKFVSLPNNYVQVGTYGVTVDPNGYTVMVPVGDFDGDDGAMNYKLTGQGVITPGHWTGVRDYMPDLGLPPGSSARCPNLMTIDIKPGSYPNSVNCRNENANIAVAILGAPDFDVSMVDWTTAVFEGATEWHVDKQTGIPRRHLEDVDMDGYMDLVFHFHLVDTVLDCDSTEGTLTVLLYDGTELMGTDSIRMVDKLDTPMGP
jgi:hypothetical protein